MKLSECLKAHVSKVEALNCRMAKDSFYVTQHVDQVGRCLVPGPARELELASEHVATAFYRDVIMSTPEQVALWMLSAGFS